MRKSDKHTKHTVGLLIQKFICYYPSFVVIKKRERVSTEPTTLDRQREINSHKMRKTGIDLDIHFFVFCCSSHTCLLGILSSCLCGRRGTSSELTQNKCCKFLACPQMSAAHFQLSFSPPPPRFLSHIHFNDFCLTISSHWKICCW